MMARLAYCVTVAIVLSALSRSIEAQSPSDTTSRRVQQSAWVTLGFGRSTNAYMSGGSAAIASGWYSLGPFAAGARTTTTATTGLFLSSEDPVEDAAVLIGLRTTGRRAFLLGALGYASVDQPPGVGWTGKVTSNALAYSFQASANYRFVGLAAEVFGAQGSERASFRAFALSVQLGWFGK